MRSRTRIKSSVGRRNKRRGGSKTGVVATTIGAFLAVLVALLVVANHRIVSTTTMSTTTADNSGSGSTAAGTTTTTTTNRGDNNDAGKLTDTKHEESAAAQQTQPKQPQQQQATGDVAASSASEADASSASSFASYRLFVRNRDPAALKEEAQMSCQMNCPHGSETGMALSPPQIPYWFEGHGKKQDGGGKSRQIHPSRAVYEIYQKYGSREMSFVAVDIGATGGSPEADPLFRGKYDKLKWKGVKVDAREKPRSASKRKQDVRSLNVKAVPPTIAGILQNACVPANVDLLKVDIDCYDWDVTKALLVDAGMRPKVFAAEIQVPIPPPVHFHVGYDENFEWSFVSGRPKEQQILYGASLSAYSDLLKPLGYTLLTVDYYNVVYVHDRYKNMFQGIPTDDLSAWKTGWYDRPERKTQPDLQKYWLNFPKMEDWVGIIESSKSDNNDDRLLGAVYDHLDRAKGPRGTITREFLASGVSESAVRSTTSWSVGPDCGQ